MPGPLRGSSSKTFSAASPRLEMEILNRWLAGHPRTRLAVLTLYYLAIIAALILLYGRGDFSTPPFVYQDF
jgi:hypothetical protein